MRPEIITRALLALSATSIALSQTPAGAGNLVLNGALVAAGVAQLAGGSQHVTIASGANISNRTLVITGTNDSGATISETITGPNVATVNSVLNYRTVSSISISGSAAGALTVGNLGTGESDPIPLDIYVDMCQTTISLEINGTANVDVQFTNDNPFGKDPITSETGYTQTPVGAQGLVWFPHPVAALVGATGNVNGSTNLLMRAVRLKHNSGTGTVRMTVAAQGGA
jgi:hypothetical protein